MYRVALGIPNLLTLYYTQDSLSYKEMPVTGATPDMYHKKSFPGASLGFFFFFAGVLY